MTTLGHHPFTVTDSEGVYDGAIIAVRRDTVVMPEGATTHREVVEHRGAVAVVALDEHQRVLLEYQYRHPVQRRLWELPAGILDCEGESPLAAAQRELREETAYAAHHWHTLVDTITSPGFSDEAVRIFFACDLYPVTRETPREEEADMVLHWVPLKEAVEMVFSGEIVNSIAVAGLLGAAQLLEIKSEGSLRPAECTWDTRPWRFTARRNK